MKSLMVAAVLLLSTSVFAECFSKRSVRSWDHDSIRDVVIIRALGGQYELYTPFCRDLPWARSIGFDNFGGSFVCDGDRLVAYDAWNRVLETCPISSITRVK